MADDRVSELVIRGKNLSDQAFNEASRNLSGLQSNAAAASRDMGDLGTRGTKAFTDMRGAVSELAGALGIALSLQGLVSFGAELLRMGDQIQKTADRTGLTIEQVQRLQFVADQSGNTIEDLTGAVGQLQNRLASGDASALSALKQINLTFDDLASKNPYEQMQLVAGAIGEIPNPAQQAQIAMDLFGKTGLAILPTLKSDFLGLAAAAPVMSDATVKALDTAGDELSKFKTWVKVTAAEAYTTARGMFDSLIAIGMSVVGSLAGITAKLLEMAQTIPGASKVIPGLSDKIKDARDAAVWFKDASAAMSRQILEQTAVTTKATPAIVAHGKAAADAGDAHRQAGKAIAEETRLTAEQVAIQALIEKAKRNEAASVRFAEAAWRSWESTVSKALRTIADTPVPPILQGRNLSGIAPVIDVPASTFKLPPGAKKGFFESVFGTPQEFGAALSGTILAAIQGGGDVFNAAGGMIGQKLGTSIAGTLSKSLLKEGAGVFSQALGGMFNAVLPGIGSLLGPLMSKAWDGIKNLFGMGTAGRDLVKDFAASFGGFDALQKKLLELGPEYERLWKNLTQNVGRNNAQQARAAIEEVTRALEANEQKVRENAAAVEEAAKQTDAAQQAAMDAAKERVQALDDQIKSLEDSIAGEAPEEVMGIVEAQARAQIDALKKQREAAAATMETLNKNTAESLDDVAEALKNLPNEIQVKVRIAYEEGGFTGGFSRGAPTTAGSGGASSSASVRPVQLVITGRGRQVLAQTVLEEQAVVLGAYGAARRS